MTPSTSSLALISSAELSLKPKDLARLQAGAIEQILIMRRLRGEEALRGLLVGMTLHRIKRSLPAGKFGPWVEANITVFGRRYVNYLMRLSLVFVDKTKVTKPELLALPGDQTELAIETMEGAQRRFFDKAVKFVGELSLNELLIKYNIKAVGLKSGLTAGDDEPDDLTPEQRVQRACEAAWLDAWNPIQELRLTLTDPNKAQLITDQAKVEQLKSEVVEIAKLIDERLATLRATKV